MHCATFKGGLDLLDHSTNMPKNAAVTILGEGLTGNWLHCFGLAILLRAHKLAKAGTNWCCFFLQEI